MSQCLTLVNGYRQIEGSTMFEYFRGWKRKAGLGTLALACLVTAIWLRTYSVADLIWIGTGTGRFSLMLMNGRAVVWKWPGSGTIYVFHQCSESPSGMQQFINSWRGSREWERTNRQVLPDLELVMQFEEFTPQPLMLVAFPLAALSAWLLLSRRRETQPSQATP